MTLINKVVSCWDDLGRKWKTWRRGSAQDRRCCSFKEGVTGRVVWKVTSEQGSEGSMEGSRRMSGERMTGQGNGLCHGLRDPMPDL